MAAAEMGNVKLVGRLVQHEAVSQTINSVNAADTLQPTPFASFTPTALHSALAW